MSAQDEELERMKAGVSCALLLERHAYRLDKGESTKASLKYRRGKGEIVIVNHQGRGWWHTGSAAKGDVVALAQHLDPSRNMGHVRKLLRGLAGISPAFPEALRTGKAKRPAVPARQRWERARRLRTGSDAWDYLARARELPGHVLAAAAASDAVRAGSYGCAWFAHRDQHGAVTGIEMRGPGYCGLNEGGEKTLFRLPGGRGLLTRLAVNEAPVDALSLAALEGVRADTLYLATAGGMGPSTIACLEGLLGELATYPQAALASATDADEAGDRYHERLAELASVAGVRSERLRPQGGLKDWNDVWRAQRGLG